MIVLVNFCRIGLKETEFNYVPTVIAIRSDWRDSAIDENCAR
jgi:hypothetical protein